MNSPKDHTVLLEFTEPELSDSSDTTPDSSPTYNSSRSNSSTNLISSSNSNNNNNNTSSSNLLHNNSSANLLSHHTNNNNAPHRPSGLRNTTVNQNNIILTAYSPPTTHVSPEVRTIPSHFASTRGLQQTQQEKPQPLFSRSRTAPPGDGSVFQQHPPESLWTSLFKGTNPRVEPLQQPPPPPPPAPKLNSSAPATPTSTTVRKPPPFPRTGSMVNMLNPKKNYITRKSTQSIIEKPTTKEVFWQCFKLVFFLLLLSVIAFIPGLMWSFYNTFYWTAADATPYNMSCSVCRNISEAFTICAYGIYPFLLLIAIFGWDKTKFLKWPNIISVTLIVTLGSVIYWAATSLASFVIYPLWAIIMVINGVGFSRRFGLEKMFTVYFAVPFVLEAVFLLLNDYTIITAFINNTGTLYRIFLRNFVHPVYYSILVLALRNCARRLHSDRAVMIIFMPLFFKSFFGRIFNEEMGSYGLIALNSFLSVILDVVVRLGNWNRHKVFLWLHQKYPNTWRRQGAMQWVFDTPEEDVFYGQFLNYEKAHETIGIFMSITLTFISCVYEARYSDLPVVAYSLLIQLSIELSGQVGISMLEYYFNVPILNSTRHYKEFMPIFMFSTLLGSMFCSVRGYVVITGQWDLYMQSA